MRQSTSNGELLASLQRQGTLQTPAVLQAFRAVDRRRFLGTEASAADAYMNHPIRLRFSADVGGKAYEAESVHLSAPFIYAYTAEAFALEPGMSFLNVGSGIGYFSSIIAHILGPRGTCHGIELRADLVEAAQALAGDFAERETAAPMTFVAGNAFSLDADRSVRYDRVYVGGGVSGDAVPFFKRFVRRGGMLVGPFSDELRKYIVHDDRTEDSVLMGVSFAPLVRNDRLPSPVHHGGSLLIEPALWQPRKRNYQDACESFRRALIAAAVLQKRGEEGFPRHLDPSLWHHIFRFCPMNWFNQEPTDLVRLRHELDAERNARMLLQEQVDRVQRERDQAMTLCSIMRARLMQIARARARERGEDSLHPRDRELLETDESDEDSDLDDFMMHPQPEDGVF